MDAAFERKIPSSEIPLDSGPNDADIGEIRCECTEKLDASTSQHERDDARSSFLGFFRFFGAGFMSAVAFLDPGNLEADINVGVSTRFSLLWWYGISTLLFGFAFQALAGKLGLVTGKDLAYQVGKNYPRGGRVLLWILLEISLLAADVQETVGCALAVQILSRGRIPLWAGCLLVSAAAFAMLQLDRIGYRMLEACYGVLITLEAIALGIGAISTGAPVEEVARGFIPTLSSDTIIVAAGALGALVMPYNTFFQSHVINGRPRDRDTDVKKGVLISYMKIETFFMLSLAFVINIFAVIIFANFSSTYALDEVGLASAGSMIASTFGDTILMMWAVGLLASGLVATLCLTYAGQIIMVGLLELDVQASWRLLTTRLISLLPCLALAVVFEATHTFDKVAQTINVVQSLCLPFGLIPVVQMTANEGVMGEKWKNAKWVTAGISVICLAVFGVNVFTLVSIMNESLPANAAAHTGFSLVIALYCGLVIYFAVGPNRWPKLVQRGRSTAHTMCDWIKNNRRWADLESMIEVH